MRRLLLSFALWTPYVLLYTVQQIVIRARGDVSLDVPRLLGQQLAFFVPWAFATPFVLELGERFAIHRGRWLAPLSIHLAAIIVLAGLHCIAIVVAEAPSDLVSGVSAWVGCMSRGMLLLDAFLYLTVSLAGVSLRLRQKHRERERDVAHLQVQLAEARLRTLEAQLHPHFAFNALNTVAMLIRERRNDVALRTLVAFSDLLRQCLTRDAPLVLLEDELDSARRYLEIESMRLGDRLQVVVDAEPRALQAVVPSLLLQPLIENAIRHGACAREGPFHLLIRAKTEGQWLDLKVQDDGPGLPAGWCAEESCGLGLRNTRERLRQIYGDAARFDLTPAEEQGLRVSIQLPVRPENVAKM